MVIVINQILIDSSWQVNYMFRVGIVKATLPPWIVWRLQRHYDLGRILILQKYYGLGSYCGLQFFLPLGTTYHYLAGIVLIFGRIIQFRTGGTVFNRRELLNFN